LDVSRFFSASLAPGALRADRRSVLVVRRSAARRSTRPATTGPARPAHQVIAQFPELIGGEDRLELPLHALFNVCDLLELSVGQHEFIADERR
jgi:hypothetical protein